MPIATGEYRLSANVLFIAGAGRSGTTFLSLVLSQHPDTQNVGQIRDLHQAVAEGEICSCGVKVADCPYWGPVRRQFEADFGKGALDTLSDDAIKFRQATKTSKDWAASDYRAQMASAHASFLTRLERLYSLSAAQGEGRMLIDSSKSVDLAFALGLIPSIRLKILNLVRDPHAVAVSWGKKMKNQDKLRRRTAVWATRQQDCAVLQTHAPADFMLLRYEDLTDAPRDSIGAIQDWAGLSRNLSSFSTDHDTAVSWDRAHLFRPANGTVLKEHRTEMTIRSAESWRDPANAAYHAMAEELCFPIAATLGYAKGVA
jgi:Sulfotransferase family